MFGGSRVNAGLFLAPIALFLVWLLMKKTTLGFEVRSVGLNPFASEYAGMSASVRLFYIYGDFRRFSRARREVEGLGTYQNFFVQNHFTIHRV